MFSVKELAERYGVTRQTMNNKVNMEEMTPYVINDNGKKVTAEGLEMLNVLMAKGNVKSSRQEVDAKIDSTVTAEKDKHIQLLESQIEELKKDKERLYNELKEQRQIFLLSGEVEKKEDKKGFLKRLFG